MRLEVLSYCMKLCNGVGSYLCRRDVLIDNHIDMLIRMNYTRSTHTWLGGRA